MSGSALDDLFDRNDVAVGCLGCHRKNIVHVKALKNIEYAARGIPFIYSESNEDFDFKEYVLKIPANESPVDIAFLVAFSKNMNMFPEEIRTSVNRLTWNEQMSKVVKVLNQII